MLRSLMNTLARMLASVRNHPAEYSSREQHTCLLGRGYALRIATRNVSLASLILAPLFANVGCAATTDHVASNTVTRGEFVLRATADDHGFCAAYTANLNQFRNLKFDTCSPRLSSKYPRFSRPLWQEIPLDIDMAKRIMTDRPSVGFERWQKITEHLRAAGKIKMWRAQIDLLGDGRLDNLVRLDHASDGTRPHCIYFDSKQMITNIANPKVAKWYAHAHFYNDYQLGGDLIFDDETARYYLLNWNRYGPALGGGKTLVDIGATASLMVNRADDRGIGPVCWIDWVPTHKSK